MAVVERLKTTAIKYFFGKKFIHPPLPHTNLSHLTPVHDGHLSVSYHCPKGDCCSSTEH